MVDTIRWGVFATGGIAATFTEDLRLLPNTHISAVGSRSVESARAFADRYGVPSAYGSVDELAAAEDVDIVYVANTPNGHHDAAATLLKAGKPVLCEKPFTLNHGQAQSLVDIAEKSGVFLMEAMWMSCNPAIVRMREVVRAGAIGAVSMVSADFWLPGSFGADHRLRDPERGGGALLDLGVYPITLAYNVLGMPSVINAIGTLTPEGVDASCAMTFGYDSGAVATLSCGLGADSPVSAVIAGDKARIELPNPFFCPDRFHLCRKGSKPQSFHAPFTGKGMTHEAAEAMRCLRSGLLESPLVPWRASLDVMTIMDEVRERIGVRYPIEIG
ncbi:Gfo/Idh/MocA family protein [Stackebrandtia soli]|uniref:Gfo/Idh/MocA family protein n=1 Tax=Stackebrandtia soli TaxID=1892856 RepID=UPI0039EB9F4F